MLSYILDKIFGNHEILCIKRPSLIVLQIHNIKTNTSVKEEYLIGEDVFTSIHDFFESKKILIHIGHDFFITSNNTYSNMIKLMDDCLNHITETKSGTVI